MPIEVTCRNPECGETFSVSEDMLGETVLCPRCSRPVLVEGEEKPLAESGAAGQEARTAGEASRAEEPGAEPSHVHHPARQVCPACGAILGVRVTYCPNCGTDIRTGGISEDRKAEEWGVSAVLLTGGLLVGLAVVVVLGFAAFGMLRRRGGGPEPAAAIPEPAEQEPAEPPPPTLEPEPAPAEHYELPAELAAQVAQNREQTGRSVQEFHDRLAETLRLAYGADPDQAAAYWAELYTWCAERGLGVEADLCWFRAARLEPTDPAVNRALGRTQTVEGVAVTPEQAQFLAALRPRVRVLNLSPTPVEYAVGVGDGPARPLPRGGAVEFEAESGTGRLNLYAADRLDAPVQTFEVNLAGGLTQQVELHGTYAAPGLPLAEAEKLYLAVGAGRRTGVRVQRDSAGGVLRARIGPLTAHGTSDEPFQMWYTPASQQVGFIGWLRMGDPWNGLGEHLMRGTARRPGALLVDQQAGRLWLVAGAYTRVRSGLSDPLWAVLGVVQGDLASEWERMRLARRLRVLEEDMVELETHGELEVPWQSLPRLYEGLREIQRQARADCLLQQRAAACPPGLDRARLMAGDDRQRCLFLNWPRFRPALSRALAGTGPHVMACIGTIGRPAAASDAWAARPHRPGAWEPPSVRLDDAQRAHVEMRALAILPDSFVVDRVERDWPQMKPQDRVAAVDTLRAVGTPAAVEFLGRVSERTDVIPIVEQAMLALGTIGGERALRYLGTPAVDARVRTAARTAKAVAGVPDVIEGLASFLRSAVSAPRKDFCRLLGRADTPAALLAMSVAVDVGLVESEANHLAEGLLRIGGRTATYELGRLMESVGLVWPDLLDRVEPEHAASLVPSLGVHLYQAGGPWSVAELLADIGTEPALEYLRATAQDTGSEDALGALVLNGSEGCLRTAAPLASLVGVELLRKARLRWYAAGQQDGEWAWNPGVDAPAARSLLQAVAAGGPDARARVGAAAMLAEIGGSAEAAALTEVVRQGQDEAPSAEAGGSPPGFEPPEGRPLSPDVLHMDGRPALYALGLLRERGDGAALAALRQLAGELQDGSLKAAAVTALAQTGGTAELERLRRTAAGEERAFASIAEWTAALETRLAALAALGEVGDAGFLASLPELLAEEAPDPVAAGADEQQARTLAPWWRMKLYRAGCQSLAGICRAGSPPELTARPALADRLYSRAVELVGYPVGGPPTLATERRRLRADALRAAGCLARPGQPSHVEFVRDMAEEVGKRGDELGASAIAAVADLAARSDAPEPLLGLLDGLLEGGGHDEAWREVVLGMARRPGPGLYRVLCRHVGRLDLETLAAVLLPDEQPSPGPEYARCLALAMHEITRRSRPRQDSEQAPEQEPQKPPKAGAGATAGERGGKRPRIPAGLDLTDPHLPPDVRRRLIASSGIDLRRLQRQQAVTAASSSRNQVARLVEVPWRFKSWSYSLEGLGAQVAELRERQPWVEALASNGTGDVLAAVREAGWLTEGPFGPAVAVRLAAREPAVRPEATKEVSRMLLAGLSVTEGSGAGGLTDAARRGAVVALRRMGGQQAARALYIGLVGPPLSEAALRRAGSRSLSASPVADQIGRALGTMGEARLLTDALNAAAHEFMLANPARTQGAALEGIAYLPSERDPVRLLQGFLQSGLSSQFRGAVGAALVRAVRRMGTVQDSGADT